MIHLADLFDPHDLHEAISNRHVRVSVHPTLPLRILNYTEQCAYDRAWTDVTRQCRGLIYHNETGEIVARPFPKFFNHGEPDAPELALDEPAVVTDKLDGSLGILYPHLAREAPLLIERIDGFSIATRGSFTSDQALHATALLHDRYGDWTPNPYLTYLYEVVYPANRIVVDYGDVDDLFLLAIIDPETGETITDTSDDGIRGAYRWPGPHVETHPYRTLAEALTAEPRPNAEGLVVYLPARNARVKIKQDDYVALHRILTGTNARHVWEVAAVRACRDLIDQPRHWGTYLGIDPARAEEVLALGDDWLTDVPDEFYGWVRDVTDRATAAASEGYGDGVRLAVEARRITDRRGRYEWLAGELPSELLPQVMRLASADELLPARLDGDLRVRAWKLACPAPIAPFARGEDVA